jgi:hypothetical protein
VFLYVLNLLNDGSKKNIYKRSSSEIVNDTKYITKLAEINRTLELEIVNHRIIDIFQVLYRYNLNQEESIMIINKLFNNANNSWILDKKNIEKNYRKINKLSNRIINTRYEIKSKIRTNTHGYYIHYVKDSEKKLIKITI